MSLDNSWLPNTSHLQKATFSSIQVPWGWNHHWWTESAELFFATLVTWTYFPQELHSRDLPSSICLGCVNVLNPKWQVKWRIVFTINVTEEAMMGLGSDERTKSCCQKGEKARKTRFWQEKRGQKFFQDGAFPRGFPFNSIQVILIFNFQDTTEVIK